jgi:hypothetical protein
MSARKSYRKPNNATEIVLDRNTERSNGCEVVGTDSMDQSGDEDGEQKEHKINLDFSSKITSTL